MVLQNHDVMPHPSTPNTSAETHEAIAVRDPQLALSRGNSNETVVSDLKDLRSHFVKEMGWFPDLRDDSDRYDEDGHTRHFALRGESEKVVMGMRLTQVESLGDSLSVEMLTSNEEMHQEALAHSEELNVRAAEGNLWDLTRLVHPLDGSVDVQQIKSGLVELIGAGIAESGQENDDLTWIFTTTLPMKRMLDRLGIQTRVLAQGRISAHDKAESFFCVAEPLHALQFVKDNPEEYAFTVEHVVNGLNKADAL